MGQSAIDDPTKQVKSVAGAPVNAGRRSVVKSGLTLSIVALWRIEPLEAREKDTAENKKTGSLPAVLTYDDVRSVSPALEQYTRGPPRVAFARRRFDGSKDQEVTRPGRPSVVMP